MRLFSIKEQAADLRAEAALHREGRSSVSLHEGEACVLRQTVTALIAGHSMEIEHPPIEGWILVLEGNLELQVKDQLDNESFVPAGTLFQLPHGSMTLIAIEDTVMLLTVAMGDRPT
jgi:quercetin dioxygenase-like cupin family protein